MSNSKDFGRTLPTKKSPTSNNAYWDNTSRIINDSFSFISYDLKTDDSFKKDTKNKNINAKVVTPSLPHSSPAPGQKAWRNETFAYERYKFYKTKVIEAFHQKKIFTIRGNYPQVRRALLQRGWLEKSVKEDSLQNLSQHRLLKYATDGNMYEKAAVSRMLSQYPAYFVWQFKNTPETNNYTQPYRNRIKRARSLDFCTKEGLLSCIENSHWNTIEGIAEVFTPKTHRLTTKTDIQEFEHEYRLTQCLSLLTFINEQNDPHELFSNIGTVSAKVSSIHFAVKQIEEAIALKLNEYLDSNITDMLIPTDYEWRRFIEDSDKIIKHDMKFSATKEEENRALSGVAKTLFSAKKVWPTLQMDGYLNIWIVKPYNKCRAFGIALMTDFTKIIAYVRKNCQLRYIVQKYIERPLLIYKTKFDIRQYFLITLTDAINIWMYQDCYLRFSSQEFALTDLREAVHLTNNAVQSKYANGKRDQHLPTENMWTLMEFENYLTSIDKGYIWNEKIYPKMQQNIIAVVLSSLESIDLAANTFELYGCDFMLTTNFDPVLIEINATPDMSPSTSVTARICPRALEDLVKVVIDLPSDPTAPTGAFELIYKVPWTKAPSYAQGLVVQGKSVKLTNLRKSLSSKRDFSPIIINDCINLKNITLSPPRCKKRGRRRKVAKQ